MKFTEFADLMEKIGFKSDEPAAPTFTFTLNARDLKNPIFKRGYIKIVGRYRVVSIWDQAGEVAFWARGSREESRLFPFQIYLKKFINKINA